MKKRLVLIVFVLTVMFSAPVKPMAGGSLEGRELYLQTNIWFQNPMKIPSLLYHSGPNIEAGTRVKVLKVSSRGIKFQTLRDNVVYKIVFYRKYHPGLSIEDYARLYFGPKNPLRGKQYASFTKKEKSAIDKGELKKGMGKAAVLMAYGYPPQHMTPSTKVNSWSYWTSKFQRIEVRFNKKGRIYKIVGLR